MKKQVAIYINGIGKTYEIGKDGIIDITVITGGQPLIRLSYSDKTEIMSCDRYVYTDFSAPRLLRGMDS